MNSRHIAAAALTSLVLMSCGDETAESEPPTDDVTAFSDVETPADAPVQPDPGTSSDDGPDLSEPADTGDTEQVDITEPDLPDADNDTDSEPPIDAEEPTPDLGPEDTGPPMPPADLCKPCATDADCGPDTSCVVFDSAGAFCGGDCDAPCPAGYGCQTAQSPDGDAEACLPVDSACACTEAFEGAATPCFVENDSGSCFGQRVCEAGVLSECDAATPAPEVCGGGDEDCDGAVDEEDAEACLTLFADADEDGFGEPGSERCLCGTEDVWTVLVAGDCDDQSNAIAPDTEEVCNQVDDNCDGETDPEGAPGCEPWYFDSDNDGFGVAASSICACGPLKPFTAAQTGDCDDQNFDINPDQPCGPPTCEFFVLSGGCPPGPCGATNPPVPCAGGFTCADESSCREVCSVDGHCQPGRYCTGGACLPKKTDGSTCAASNECSSNHCGGGYCCSGGACCDGSNGPCDVDNPCTQGVCGDNFVCSTINVGGACETAACNGNLFVSAGVCQDGACTSTTEDCSGESPCVTYGCDPGVGCTADPLPEGTNCGALSCVGFELTEPKTCDGAGACSGGGAQIACPGGFTCSDNGTTCRTSCDNAGDCQPDAWCSEGVCLEKKLPGEPCSADNQCFEGTCAGGECCSGCCDTGTAGSTEYARAMEICGEVAFQFQGKPNCARTLSQFGNFSHDDKDPSLGDEAMVQLSTGVAAATQNQQTGENQDTEGQDPDGTAAIAYDLCGFTVVLDVPPGAQGFAFDFFFLSAEYPEWVGSQFNDSFNAMLTAETYDNENVAFDGAGNAISINSAFFTICDGNGCTQPGSVLQGTGYSDGVGGATGWLTTTVPVKGGETITLRLVIYDEGDHIYDSDVLINNFRWLSVVSGTGPVTE